MSDSTREITRKEVAEFIGGSDNLTATFGKVGVLNSVGCFAVIRKYASSKPQPAGGPLLAVVDLRDPNNTNDKLAVPWKIPASLTLPCIVGKSNASVFDNATKGRDFTLLYSDFKNLREAIFVDTRSHFRTPEMATRYAEWLVKNNTANTPEPTIYFMSGGLVAYCNAQSFARVILNTPNAFGRLHRLLLVPRYANIHVTNKLFSGWLSNKLVVNGLYGAEIC